MACAEPIEEAAAELLLEREAKGLQVPAFARVGFALYGGFVALDGIPSLLTRLSIWLVVAIVVLVNVASIHALRQRRHVSRAGWIGVGFDVAVVCVYPLIARDILAGEGLHWAYAFKGQLVLVYLVLVVINGMALRPAYPGAVGIAAIGVSFVLFQVARAAPGLVWEEAGVLVGPALSASQVVEQIVFLSLIVGASVFTAHSARVAAVEAAIRQAERERTRREQAASVMEGRLDALRNLVASLSHELNTPLGAVRSSAETVRAAAGRLRERSADSSDAQLRKLLGIIGDTAQVSVEATARIDAVVKKMAVFSALDRGEGDPVDVNQALERTLTLIPPPTVGQTRVHLDLQARSRVPVAAPRLNLALMTVLTNAFEAVRGQGEVHVSTADLDGLVRITISDTGPGIPPERLPRLFEFHFDQSGPRVKAGLGLPAAYSLLRTYDGDLRVRSTPGSGASFILEMPGSAPGER